MTVRHCLRQVVFAEHLAAELTATELVPKADERLLAAKRGGRNRTVAQDLPAAGSEDLPPRLRRLSRSMIPQPLDRSPRQKPTYSDQCIANGELLPVLILQLAPRSV